MFFENLVPVFARRVRIAHNEAAIDGKSARVFIREKGLVSAFPDLTNLKRAIEHNNFWTMEIEHFDISAKRLVAATHFTAMLREGGCAMLDSDARNEAIAPPFPRHDGLILECVRTHDSPATWTMAWRDGHYGPRYQLQSKCSRSLFVRALEISAGLAESTLRAFELSTVSH